MPAYRRTHRNRARPTGRGFTLLEMVAVMVIIAIVSVVAMATSKINYQARQRMAVRQLASDMHFARELAISSGWSTFAKVIISSDRVEYYQTPVGGGAMVSLTDTSSGKQMMTQLGSTSDGSIYGNVDLGTFNGSSSSPQWVGFDYQGRTIDNTGTLLTSTVTITVTANGYATASITIQPETGLIQATLP